MDDDLGANSPYQNMNSGEDEIRPDFLKKNSSSGVLAAAEQAANLVVAAKTGKAPTNNKAVGADVGSQKTTGADGPRSSKTTPSQSFKSGAKEGTDEAEKKSFYKSTGRDSSNEGEAKLKMPSGLKAAAPFAILLLAVVGIVFLLIGLPVLMIGAIDYNLQKVLGFTETVGILEKQGEYVTAEMLGNGKVPSGYASELASNGIEVGQVLANGDFVRTNEYIANIEEKNGLVAAASGFSYTSNKEGELALLYDGGVITADNFVARVEAEPKLYAAYSAAADISTKFYYGEDVEKVYQDMGISRGNFNDWESTGNYDEDEKAFQEILINILDKDADLKVGGKADDNKPSEADKKGQTDVEDANYEEDTDPATNGTWSNDTDDFSASGELGKNTAQKTKEYIIGWTICEEDVYQNNVFVRHRKYLCKVTDEKSTQRAAELLNTAVSSGEPYLSANAFIAVEEPIQRARVDGDGPVNEVMNTLTQGTEVSYQNVNNTSETLTSNLSILETDNFRAVVSDAPYSLDEAENFGRDRVLKVTGQADKDVIKMTTVGVGDDKNASSVSRNGKWGTSANEETIAQADKSVEMAIYTKNSDLFQSVVGGNRIIEGGSFLSNTINSKTIGAVPSNEATVANYYQEVKEVLERKEEAERATLSPFDISSPNTFLGSIVHNFAKATIRNYSGGALNSLVAAADTTGTAVASLTGSAQAEGINQTYTTLSGKGCETVGAVGVVGDIYCTSHNTVATDFMSYTREQWKGVTFTNRNGEQVTIGDSLDEENKIKEKSELADFVAVGMDRYATVGVRSANACEAYKNSHATLWENIKGKIAEVVGMYDSCKDIPEEYSTGAIYTFGGTGSAEYTKYLSGYMLYDAVYSLLSDEESSVAEFRDRYYAKYPQEHSEAGVIALRSGMSVDEAEIALSYADYLYEIANYDASSRYAFGAPLFDVEESIVKIHSNNIAADLYAWQQKESEYEDLRTRNYVV